MAHEDLGLLSRYPAVTRHLLTVDDYHRMGEVGILTEDDRVALIEGELGATAPTGSEHAAASNALNRLLVLAVGTRGVVSVGNPVRLDRHSEPQPDFAILKSCNGNRTMLPRPEDTILAVEMANTSLSFDQRVKLPLYARSGIPEVWIVDLTAAAVEVHRSPAGSVHMDVSQIGRSGVLTIATLPGVVIPVEAILAG